MAKIGMFLALVLVGCGGPSFTVGFKEIDQADSGPQADALAAAGGVSTVASGGKVGLNVGGQPDSGGVASGGTSSGGAPSSGGLSGSGGAVDVDGGHGSGGALGTGGASADACVLVTHDNGTGQTWQDCVPLGTYNEEQAMKACEAWCAGKDCAPSCLVAAICNSNDPPNYVAAGLFISGNPAGIMGWSTMTSGTVKIANGASCAPTGTWD